MVSLSQEIQPFDGGKAFEIRTARIIGRIIFALYRKCVEERYIARL
jgi:hypothetical protein